MSLEEATVGLFVEVRNTTRTVIAEEAVACLVAGALCEEGVDNGEVGITFVGETRMRSLNRLHRGVNEVTDVLSFPLEDDEGEQVAGGEGAPPRMLGDIVLCPRQAARQAAADGLPLALELAVLLVHGVLHLLSWEHDEQPGEMALRQAELLDQLDWSALA
jgi:probable rRNA maturation factor